MKCSLFSLIFYGYKSHDTYEHKNYDIGNNLPLRSIAVIETSNSHYKIRNHSETYFAISVSSVFNPWLKFFWPFTGFRRSRRRQFVSTS